MIFNVFAFCFITKSLIQDVLAAPASAEEGEVPSGIMKILQLLYQCWHGQHDLIFSFQGNMYKQCMLIAGNMAKNRGGCNELL